MGGGATWFLLMGAADIVKVGGSLGGTRRGDKGDDVMSDWRGVAPGHLAELARW